MKVLRGIFKLLISNLGDLSRGVAVCWSGNLRLMTSRVPEQFDAGRRRVDQAPKLLTMDDSRRPFLTRNSLTGAGEMKKIGIVGSVGWESTDDEAEQDHVLVTHRASNSIPYFG